jgi:hypothetical protein
MSRPALPLIAVKAYKPMEIQAMPALTHQQAADPPATIAPEFTAILEVYPDYLQHTSLADDPTIIPSYNRFPLPDKFPLGKSWLDYPLADSTSNNLFMTAVSWLRRPSATAAPLLVTLIDSWPDSLRVGDVVLLGKFRWVLGVLSYMKRVNIDSIDPIERAIWRRAAQRIHTEIRCFAASAIWMDQDDPRSPLNMETGLEVYSYIVTIRTMALDIFRALYLKKLTEDGGEYTR